VTLVYQHFTQLHLAWFLVGEACASLAAFQPTALLQTALDGGHVT